jgi:TPR repeat protein
MTEQPDDEQSLAEFYGDRKRGASSKAGFAVCAVLLGLVAWAAIEVPPDAVKGARAFTKGFIIGVRAKQGNAHAQDQLGNFYLGERSTPRGADYEKAAEWFQKSAEQDDPAGKTDLGKLYIAGKGVTKDTEKGLALIRSAAETGYARAQNWLGYYYEVSNGRAPDYAQALDWYRKAAAANDPYGEYCLARMYSRGQGVAKDEAEAVKWLQKSVDQNYAPSQFMLGFYYLRGQGVAKDEARGKDMIRQSADRGFAQAQAWMGALFEHPKENGKPDYAQALAWYKKAADQGDSLGENGLGWMYYTGEGVPKDYAKALLWTTKAAMQGLWMAEDGMAEMYRDGNGVTQDKVTAYMWYCLAADAEANTGDHRSSEHRDALAATLTPGQIASGRARADAMKPVLTRRAEQ